MVAAEHEREAFGFPRAAHGGGDALTGAFDLGEKSRARVAFLRCFGDLRRDVAVVDHLAPERREPVGETGIADRGGTHVDAAASRAEVEGSADDRNGFHGEEANGRAG